ncbi:MAG TPA: ferrous iron transport protein B [Candidatus Competibacteraceae bacterium]|nr:MAG: ferrous iron transport protein B [Candidatus Competibacteraceae bacterium]HOB61686.1 ferrous iron transport protein B [Candidatus Competibacteraceae bacterium]HQA26389.1 ferrous iron transport protein B [Candidatus Competibacteraceae bacterium]HQD57275.1 ferrous iron transport protein B [Candidatus Competibacteraceae bacterium]
MKRIALLGMPNTGKSTFFNRLTGASARIGNWPGITVDLLSARILLGADMVEVVDLPGFYDLHGFSEDEQVVRQFLQNNPIDLLCLIINATQIDQQLPLALQLRRLGLPTVAILNMADEAEQMGIRFDAAVLTAGLDSPVCFVSAKYGHGFSEARETLRQVLERNPPTNAAIQHTEFAADEALLAEAEKLVARSVSMPRVLEHGLTERIDRIVLHPILGIPLFFLALFFLFQAVYTLGGPLQDGMTWLLTTVHDQVLAHLQPILPGWLYGLLVEGVYDGLGTVASFVPIIVLFFLGMALIEDSGYLSRIAFLMDALMAKLGLDGRGFVMLMMGFGCNVPALLGTRVMRSRSLRLLTMLIIPFSLCSARLQVFVFLTTALFSSTQAPVVLFALYVVSFLTAFGTALLFKNRLPSREPLLIELPPYRLPTFKQVILRGWHEVHHFLSRASRFIIMGVVAIWLLTHLPPGVAVGGPQSLAGIFGSWLEPLLRPIGIDQQMAVVLLFGFVAKEIVLGAMAVIYGLEGDALSHLMAQRMDWVQAFSFMLFILIYTPCLSTVATLRSESKSLVFTGVSIVWSLGLAWVISFAFYQSARLLGY